MFCSMSYFSSQIFDKKYYFFFFGKITSKGLWMICRFTRRCCGDSHNRVRSWDFSSFFSCPKKVGWTPPEIKGKFCFFFEVMACWYPPVMKPTLSFWSIKFNMWCVSVLSLSCSHHIWTLPVMFFFLLLRDIYEVVVSNHFYFHPETWGDVHPFWLAHIFQKKPTN